MRGREDVGEKFGPACHKRRDGAAIRAGVGAQAGGSGVDGNIGVNGEPAIERMSDGDGRVDPCKAVIRERQSGEGRRCGGERMNGGAKVMGETGKRQFGGPRTAPDGGLSFKDRDGQSGACERDCGREAIWPGADDEGFHARLQFSIISLQVAIRGCDTILGPRPLPKRWPGGRRAKKRPPPRFHSKIAESDSNSSDRSLWLRRCNAAAQLNPRSAALAAPSET